MLNYFLATLAASASVVGSVTDLKGRWVPDYVSFFLVLVGLIGHGLWSLFDMSVWPIVYSVIGFLVASAFAMLLFYTGQLGGGDAKMFMGFGAALPLASQTTAPWPFLVTLFLNVLLAGVIYSLVYLLVKIFMHRAEWSAEFKHQYSESKLFLVLITILIVIPLIILLIFPSMFWLAFCAWSASFVLYFLIVIAKAAEKTVFIKEISPKNLEVGDLLVSKIYKNKTIGLEQDDIKKVLEICARKGIKTLKVKDGIAYVPAFACGLIISIFSKDWVWMLVGKLTNF